MSSVLDDFLVGLCCLASAGYAIASLGPRTLRAADAGGVEPRSFGSAGIPRDLGAPRMPQRRRRSGTRRGKRLRGLRQLRRRALGPASRARKSKYRWEKSADDLECSDSLPRRRQMASRPHNAAIRG